MFCEIKTTTLLGAVAWSYQPAVGARDFDGFVGWKPPLDLITGGCPVHSRYQISTSVASMKASNTKGPHSIICSDVSHVNIPLLEMKPLIGFSEIAR